MKNKSKKQEYLCLKVTREEEVTFKKGHRFKECKPKNSFCADCRLKITSDKVSNSKDKVSCYGFNANFKCETIQKLINEKAKVLFYVSKEESNVKNDIGRFHYVADIIGQQNSNSIKQKIKFLCPNRIPKEFKDNKHKIFIIIENMKKVDPNKYNVKNFKIKRGKKMVSFQKYSWPSAIIEV